MKNTLCEEKQQTKFKFSGHFEWWWKECKMKWIKNGMEWNGKCTLAHKRKHEHVSIGGTVHISMAFALQVKEAKQNGVARASE